MNYKGKYDEEYPYEYGDLVYVNEGLQTHQGWWIYDCKKASCGGIPPNIINGYWRLLVFNTQNNIDCVKGQCITTYVHQATKGN